MHVRDVPAPTRAPRRLPVVVAVLALLPALVAAGPPHGPRHAPAPTLAWEPVDAPTTSSIRALDAVDDDTAWVASDGGEVARTTDGGTTWQSVAPPDGDGLLFRDVEAFDADHAVLLSIGTGTDARVFVTDDGGANWDETFRNPEPEAFYNCMDFWTRRHGIATGDPVDGTFRVLTTDDGGRTWTRVPDDALPDAEGEYGFSASGTCVAAAGGTRVWFGTGGTDARVFTTRDRGASWTAVDTPLRAGEAAGVFTLAFRTPRRGLALGGDFGFPDDATDAGATTDDGGRTWEPVDPTATPTGYREAADWLGGFRDTVVAVGPNGSDVSVDGGTSWSRFSDTGFHVVDCTRSGACWAAGSDGRVATLAVTR